MPFELAKRMCAAEPPVVLGDLEDINMLRVLSVAGMVEAELPPVIAVEGRRRYAGTAKVWKLTAEGREALSKYRE